MDDGSRIEGQDVEVKLVASWFAVLLPGGSKCRLIGAAFRPAKVMLRLDAVEAKQGDR